MTTTPRTGRPARQVVDGRKFCARCGENKLVCEFYKDSAMVSGYSSACKVCRTKVITPEERRRHAYRNKYGITIDQYNDFYADQDGRCAICKVEAETLCVDHDHETRKVRGLLCRECNFGLGKFADNADRLMAAAAYILMKGE